MRLLESFARSEFGWSYIMKRTLMSISHQANIRTTRGRMQLPLPCRPEQLSLLKHKARVFNLFRSRIDSADSSGDQPGHKLGTQSTLTLDTDTGGQN